VQRVGDALCFFMVGASTHKCTPGLSVEPLILRVISAKLLFVCSPLLLSVIGYCWLGVRKSIRPVKN